MSRTFSLPRLHHPIASCADEQVARVVKTSAGTRVKTGVRAGRRTGVTNQSMDVDGQTRFECALGTSDLTDLSALRALTQSPVAPGEIDAMVLLGAGCRASPGDRGHWGGSGSMDPVV